MNLNVFNNLPPIHYLLNGHDIYWDESNKVLSIKYKAVESFTNPKGTIEGGMICAMLDDAMGILSALNKLQKPTTTLNLNVDFIKPCFVGDVEVKAFYIKEGKTILNIKSEAWQQGQLIAICNSSFLVLATK